MKATRVVDGYLYVMMRALFKGPRCYLSSSFRVQRQSQKDSVRSPYLFSVITRDEITDKLGQGPELYTLCGECVVVKGSAEKADAERFPTTQ